MMVKEGMRLGAIGIVVGLALAAATTRLMQGWLFGVSPLDIRTFAGMAAVFVAVALIASYIPARRAAGTIPCQRCGGTASRTASREKAEGTALRVSFLLDVSIGTRAPCGVVRAICVK